MLKHRPYNLEIIHVTEINIQSEEYENQPNAEKSKLKHWQIFKKCYFENIKNLRFFEFTSKFIAFGQI